MKQQTQIDIITQIILKQYEEDMLTRGIQKLTKENPSFQFLQEDPDIYTIEDAPKLF